MSQHSALFSQQAYEMVKSGNKADRLNKINKTIGHTGFEATDKSNRDMLHLVNKTTGEHHISVRGTDASSGLKTKEDIKTDALFGLGMSDKHFKKKINRIDKLVKGIPHEAKITASGHSLGGGIITGAMKTKRNIRRRITDVNTYNPAVASLTPKASKVVEKELKNKITHHRNKNDFVSASILPNNLVGTVKEHEPKKLKKPKSIPKKMKHLFDSLDQLKHHSIDQFIDQK
jgi:hypothetical protein